MAPRTVKLLHVEDDPVQQLLTAQQLTTLPDYSFAITCADSEDQAVAEFERSRQEVVVLDYHLARGNGLSCLQRLRQLDRIVPVIALSGKATPEIAAELLKAGADNYLSKKDLATETFAGCIKDALIRADAWRRHAPTPTAGATAEVGQLIRQIFQGFASGPGLELQRQLDGLEAAVRRANLNVQQVQQLVEAANAEIESARPADGPPLQRILRPIALELIVRLWGDQLGEE
jgi:CheY-like chemotaxis protein